MKLVVIPLSLSGVMLIRAKRYLDPRGYFAETYVRRDFATAGIGQEFVQDNQSGSSASGTVRGLHFQIPPFAQAKLVRVLRGRILDVVVDLRRAFAELWPASFRRTRRRYWRTISALWWPTLRSFTRSRRLFSRA